MPTSLRRHDEPGHAHFWTISCYRGLAFFYNDDMKCIVIDALRMLHERYRICLMAYVIMPEHLHAVIYPHPRGEDEPVRISTLLHAFKKHIGFHGRQCLRRIWRTDGQLWSGLLNQWARHEYPRQDLLYPRGYDFNIDRLETLIEKVDYCHKNPVTRELVNHPEDWPWSSFRYHERDDASVLAMNWDGSWPVNW